MIGTEVTTQSTGFRTTDITGVFGGGALFAGHGLIAGTRIATQTGWTVIDDISKGDMVMTYDHGMQVVVDICRTCLLADAHELPETMLPVQIPAGAMGNADPLCLPPEQGVMVDTQSLQDSFGDPLAVVPASALVGYNGIDRARDLVEINIITLYFVKPEVIFAEGGARVFCPKARLTVLERQPEPVHEFDMMAEDEAAFLVDMLLETEEMPTPPSPNGAALMVAA